MARDYPRLEARDVRVHFEGVKAVDGVDLRVEVGDILGLIGPNGAGKTTLVNVLSGFQRPTGGSVWLGDVDVTGWAPSELARRGLARTFQSVRLFPAMSVFENVQLGGIGVGLGFREARRKTWEVLDWVGLARRADEDAAGLPHGDAHLVGIARALAAQPRMLLLDEPAAGLNEEESDALLAALAAVRERLDIGLLIVEHDMRLIMRLCDRVHILDYGETLSIGTPDEVRADPRVVEAYLGSQNGSAPA